MDNENGQSWEYTPKGHISKTPRNSHPKLRNSSWKQAVAPNYSYLSSTYANDFPALVSESAPPAAPAPVQVNSGPTSTSPPPCSVPQVSTHGNREIHWSPRMKKPMIVTRDGNVRNLPSSMLSDQYGIAGLIVGLKASAMLTTPDSISNEVMEEWSDILERKRSQPHYDSVFTPMTSFDNRTWI